MSEQEPRYISYLVRLWQIRSSGMLVWRASLESPQASERVGFANLEALFSYLRQQVSADSDGGGTG